MESKLWNLHNYWQHQRIRVWGAAALRRLLAVYWLIPYGSPLYWTNTSRLPLLPSAPWTVRIRSILSPCYVNDSAVFSLLSGIQAKALTLCCQGRKKCSRPNRRHPAQLKLFPRDKSPFVSGVGLVMRKHYNPISKHRPRCLIPLRHKKKIPVL